MMVKNWKIPVLLSIFLVSQTVGAVRTAERFAIRPRLDGWVFSNGPEYPGAKGTLEYFRGAIELKGDFTGGGDYVAVTHRVEASDFNELRFKVKSSVMQIAVRFRDSQRQVHQHFVSVGLNTDDWIELAVPVVGSPRNHWDGANDGVMRGPVKEISFVVHKIHFAGPKGSALIKDVRLCRNTTPPEIPLNIAKFNPAEAVVNGRASLGKQQGALILEIAGNQPFSWPGVNLKPQNGSSYFDLSGGEVLVMEVTNLMDYPASLRCQIENLGANGSEFCVKGGRGFEPGETATMRIRFYRNGVAPDDVVFEAVQNPFEGLRGANNLDVKKITNIMLFELTPMRDLKFAIRNIRVEEPWRGVSGAVKSAKTFYPAIDVYGQYKHKEWDGKTHNDAELAAARQEEQADLAAHPRPAGWNRFGGWEAGPAFEATGNFYPRKYNGKWWLVDPEGKLFFSHGIDQFGGNEVTGIALREHYFEGLPERDDPASREFWGNPTPGAGFYRGRKTLCFDHYSSNLKRKYGRDYRNISRRLFQERAGSWGINTMGNWSWSDYVRLGRTPYVIFGETYRDCPPIRSQLGGPRAPFVDVFDPKFEEGIVASLSRRWKAAVNDPMCIGAFVDNERKYGEGTTLAEAVLRSPADQAAKREFRRRLEQKYGDIAKLNAAWKSSYASWDAFLNETALPDLNAAREDLKVFDKAIIDRYFQGCRNAVRRFLPGKLYLGSRFERYENVPRAEVVAAAAKYCDVLSFNLYCYSVADFRLPDGVDKPVLIGEFHFGTIDNGHANPGITGCADNAERADAYRFYVKTALRHPNFVGCHYYRLIDEHPAGRLIDNENMGIGFVDICDRPYPEMVQAAREIGADMYRIRAGK